MRKKSCLNKKNIFDLRKKTKKKIEIKKFLKILKLKYEDKENQKEKKRVD